MNVAEAWNQTLPCPDCGKWGARWTSQLAGHDIIPEHTGDVVMWCRGCGTISNVLISEWNAEVRMSPEEVDWAERSTWYHFGSDTWDEDCPGDVRVHVGRRETSEWLWRACPNSYKKPTLYTLELVGTMPKRILKDVGDGWGSMSCAYVNRYEYPGSVSLYLPKERLRVVDKVEL